MYPAAEKPTGLAFRFSLLDAAGAAGLAALLALSWHLFTVNIDYSFGHNSEEVKKASFILNGTQDFLHPVLMLQSVRFINLLAGADTIEKALLLGRETIAAFSVAFVLACYVLARLFVPALAALGCAAMTAVAPLTVVHAHYLKEDMHFSLFAILALAALVVMARSPNRNTAIAFGALAGLAAASKYAGALVFVLAYFLPRFAAQDFDSPAYRAQLRPVLLTGLAVFALANLPAFFTPLTFITRLGGEVVHPIGGGDIKLLPFEFLWTYHLRYSLSPGMTIYMLAPALAAMIMLFSRWHKQGTDVRIILVAAAGYYFLIESTPMKPWPDFMRYTVPLVPLLVLMLMIALHRLILQFWPQVARDLAAGGALLLVAVLASLPAYGLSQRYNEAFRLDTRDVAEKILDALPGAVIIERYTRNCTKDTCLEESVSTLKQTLASYLPKAASELSKYDYAGIASFRYARILLSRTLWVHPADHEAYARVYETVLQRPRLVIASNLPAMGYIDPVIQIADLKGNGSALAPYRGTARDGQIWIEFIPAAP